LSFRKNSGSRVSGTGRLNIDSPSAPSLFGISTIGQSSGTNVINTDILVGVIEPGPTTQNWSVGTGGTLIINGSLSGQSVGILEIGTVTTGTGILRLNGSSSGIDETHLVAGTVQVGNNGAFGSGAVKVLGSGAGATLEASGGARTLANAFTLESGVTLTAAGSNTLTFDGVLSGAGSLRASLSGTTIMSKDATFTGTTTINSGATLQLGNNGTTGRLASTGAGIVLDGGGTLSINRSDTVIIDTTNNPLSGAGLVQNVGSGIAQFNGNTSGSFTGDVLVVGGEIYIGQLNALGGNGSTGTFTVNSGARLSFASREVTRSGNVVNNGEIQLRNDTNNNGMTFVSGKSVSGSGAFLVNSPKNNTADFTFSGDVAPGAVVDTAGQLTFGDGVVDVSAQFTASSEIIWNLTGTGGVAGTDFDAFALSSGANVDLLSGAALRFDLVYAWDDNDAYWQSDHSYALFSTSAVTGTFDLVDEVYSGAGGTGTFSFDGQNIQYGFTAVPEPGVAGLVALALFGLVLNGRLTGIKRRRA